MEFMVIKTSGNYLKFKSYNSVEDLIKLKERCHHDLILTDNFLYKEDPKDILNFWGEINLATAEKMSKTKYTIEIYDDYRE